MRLVLVVLVLVAGCASPGAVEDVLPPAPDATAAPTFLVEERPLDCGSCFEATLAIDPASRLFLVAAGTAEVLVSEDEGTTWTTRPGPPLPQGVSADVGDALVQVAPDGTLYYSALIAERLGLGAPGLFGIQVAWSTDAAATWTGNTILSPKDSPGVPVVYPDRQWLGFADDGTIYLTYNQLPSGIWVARSDDGGATWGGWTRAAPVEDRIGAGQSGPPVVDPEGTVFVPGCALAPAGLAVYASTDGGATFSREDVPSSGCSWFPVVAVAPDGALVAAWTDTAGLTFVSVRDPATGAWSEAVEWARSSVTSPWPLPRADGGLDLVWLGGESGTAVHLASGDRLAAPARDLVLAEGLDSGGETHYAHGARFPDGRLGLAWTADAAIFTALEARAP